MCSCLGNVARKVLVWLISLAQFIMCCCIIGFTAWKLANYSSWSWSEAVNFVKTVVQNNSLDATGILSYTCLLGGYEDGSKPCNVAYGFSAISMAVSLAVSILLCVSCDCCGMGKYINFIFYGCGTAWWAIAVAVMMPYIKRANDQSAPQNYYRGVVQGLIIAMLVSFCLLVLLGLYEILSPCCCTGDKGEGGGKGSNKVSPDTHSRSAAPGEVDMVRSAPPVQQQWGDQQQQGQYTNNGYGGGYNNYNSNGYNDNGYNNSNGYGNGMQPDIVRAAPPGQSGGGYDQQSNNYGQQQQGQQYDQGQYNGYNQQQNGPQQGQQYGQQQHNGYNQQQQGQQAQGQGYEAEAVSRSAPPPQQGSGQQQGYDYNQQGHQQYGNQQDQQQYNNQQGQQQYGNQQGQQQQQSYNYSQSQGQGQQQQQGYNSYDHQGQQQQQYSNQGSNNNNNNNNNNSNNNSNGYGQQQQGYDYANQQQQYNNGQQQYNNNPPSVQQSAYFDRNNLPPVNPGQQPSPYANSRY